MHFLVLLYKIHIPFELANNEIEKEFFRPKSQSFFFFFWGGEKPKLICNEFVN